MHKDKGFTLIELIVIVVIVGVLATIAAPSWLAFVNRQRVNKANDAVLAAIQEAQREAKKNKRDYSVSFRVNTQIPEIAIHPNSAVPRWQPLGGDVGVEAKQIVFGTNIADIDGTNNRRNTLLSPPINGIAPNVSFTNLTTQRKITFDYMGILASKTDGNNSDTGFKFMVSVPGGANPTQPSSLKRCVIIDTLIGGIRTAKDGECN
ncbi:MAG: prepilin-type N-terminal cleavage/methylation domain-containing protein [Scytonematopsis contorta HA4267-MV1]|nr:prepilin-type N-terminal cleavage/methylation domain-containing protein [Scytonematopsis contorta HA4267-MV1]